VRITGCSVDTLDAQKAFAEKTSIRFPLIADEDGSIARAYGVYRDDWKVAGRATAIIDEDGVILKTYPKAAMDGKGHAEEVYQEAQALFA
jgi:peroxiredoxin Q/BCP